MVGLRSSKARWVPLSRDFEFRDRVTVSKNIQSPAHTTLTYRIHSSSSTGCRASACSGHSKHTLDDPAPRPVHVCTLHCRWRMERPARRAHNTRTGVRVRVQAVRRSSLYTNTDYVQLSVPPRHQRSCIARPGPHTAHPNQESLRLAHRRSRSSRFSLAPPVLCMRSSLVRKPVWMVRRCAPCRLELVDRQDFGGRNAVPWWLARHSCRLL
jgi:hypothetical protein